MKKNVLCIGLLTCASLLVTSNALAYTKYYDPDEDASTNTLGSWYIGGAIGRSVANVKSSYFFGSPDVTSTGVGGKGYIGFQFNPNIALEFTYFQFATFDVQPDLFQPGGAIRPKAFEFSAVGMYPVNRNITLGLTTGVFLPSYSVDPDIIYADVIDRSPKNRFGFGYGLFGQYMIEQNAYIRAGWDQLINSGPAVNIKPDSGMASIGLMINLGSA